jgi:two-component system sensor histidine kinase KdpD
MTYDETRRPDPEELLRWVQKQEKKEKRGRLKIFLGYASGVGKTYRLLDEGRRRKERGQDVAVGAAQAQRSEDAERILAGLERLSPGDELDVEAVLARHPQVCLIDELARDNPPGSRHAHRWQDAQELLDAGISVIAAINIQRVEELQKRIAAISGSLPSVTVPEAFLRAADEITLVDASPEAIHDRAEGGASGESGRCIAKREAMRLSELREIALLFAAEMVDQELDEYAVNQGLERKWRPEERILACITPYSDARRMIRSGRRAADRFHGEWFVVFVTPDEEGSGLNAEEKALVREHLNYARSLGAHVETILSSDIVTALTDFARSHRITQIYVGHSLESGWRRLLFGSALHRIIRASEGMDVRVFPNRKTKAPAEEAGSAPPPNAA